MLAFLLQLIKIFRICFAHLIWRTVQPQCLNLSSFLRPQSPLWPKSGPNGAQENAWTRSDWAAWFIPTIVVQEWASLENGRDYPKYGFAVVGMTALDFGHNFAQVGLFSYSYFPPSWVLQEWAWLGCWSQLCPGLPFPSLRPAVWILSSLVEILSFPFSFRIFSGSYLYLDWLSTHGGFSCTKFLSLCFKTHWGWLWIGALMQWGWT